VAAVNEPALEMSAVLHEVEVIEFGELVALCFQRLDNGALYIVNEYHDVRKLQRCVAAYLHARWNAGGNGGFRSAHLGLAALVVVVLLQVDGSDKSGAYLPVGLCAAHEYQRGLILVEQSLVEVLLHGAVDLCNAGVRVRLLEVDLGEYEVQRGGSVPCYLGGLSPVFRLAGVLVACDYRPFCHSFRVKLREEDIR